MVSCWPCCCRAARATTIGMSDEAISVRVGQRVKALRVRAGMTQAALAERSGMSTQAISRIERGNRTATLDTLDRIAAGLGVGFADLAEAAESAPRARTFSDDLVAVIEPLIDQPERVRARAARLVAALVDE